ncbi:MAG: hypothetical protein HRT36_05290 [Alphaproteobacteria bacterium]|nr:hypothetical protein [Alphaproteobacteria bacterium]
MERPYGQPDYLAPNINADIVTAWVEQDLLPELPEHSVINRRTFFLAFIGKIA